VIPLLACRASAASPAPEQKSATPSIADVQNQKHCDDDSDSKDNDSATAKDDSKDDSDDSGSTDAKAQPGDDDSGCSDDADNSDHSNDDDDDTVAVDPDERPSLLSQFDYYTDSQHYVNLTTTSLATAPFHDFMTYLRRDWMQGRDTNGAQAAEITTLGFNKEFTELWSIGGGFGTARNLEGDDLVGSFQSHLNYEGASATASIAREMLLESAKAVSSNIRQTIFGLSVSDDLTERISMDMEAHHRSYSDGNTSNDIAFSPDYTFKLAMSKLALGYRFSYIAFAQNPDQGYWAPRKALSNGMSAVWSFDRMAYYARTELGLSYDSIRQAGKLADGPSSGPSASAGVTFGIRPIDGISLETYWTGNGSASWNSMNIGLSLNYLFQNR
jgi:hypothetical protein